jgi:type II secretory ATPase GspE/PulE/Tfp pilus assembly ATPase PilB-like protein
VATPEVLLTVSSIQTSPVAVGAAKPVHRIRRLIPSVGRHLENKVVVCETFDQEVAILVLEGFESSPQVNEIKLKMQRRFPKQAVEVYAHSSLELLTYAKAQGDAADSGRQSSSGYEKALEDIVRFAVENRASDITLDINSDKAVSPILYKIDGRQIQLDAWQMKTERLEEIVNIAWQGVTGGSQSSFNKQVESQGIYSLAIDQRDFKLRFQSIIADSGPTISLRLLEQRSVKPLTEYGYLPSHLDLLNRYKNSRSGFIVFSGKVDSGKTTSQSALVATLPKHYKTFMLEDPVEIIIDGVYQITLARPVDGSGDANYSRKLMALKRAAPDAISMGEVRDGLNARAVADVGGMGILGLFTVHASSALHAPQKLWSESVGVPRDFLSSPGMFKLFVHQALVPRLCSCANPLYSLTEQGGVDQDGVFQPPAYWQQYIQQMESAFKIDASGMKVRNHHGCDKCRRPYFDDLNGYSGRQLLAEMIEVNMHHNLLRLIGQGDALGMYEYTNTLHREDLDNPDMANKTIVECGLYWALQGRIDPRDVELATEPFANLILQPRYN